MLLYRIAKCMYADDLSGTGARLYGGRWNSVGKPVVYLASSRALAVLEVLVHLPPALIPSNYCLVTLDVPDDVTKIDLAILPPNWQEFPEPGILKTIGDEFILSNKHLLCCVPSAIVKEEYNFLLNPSHAKFLKVKILSKEPFSFDERLVS
jgi:RES domain-containing protein